MAFIHQGSNPGSSPVRQLHRIQDDGRDIRLRKLRRSELPGDLSILGLREYIRELVLLDRAVLDLGVAETGVVDLGEAEIGVVDLGGVAVGVMDFGGVPFGVVDFGGDPFGVVVFDFESLGFGLLDRLPHREEALLPQRERVLLGRRDLCLSGEYVFCGRAHASKLNPSICESTACQNSASPFAPPRSASKCQSGKSGRCWR